MANVSRTSAGGNWRGFDTKGTQTTYRDRLVIAKKGAVRIPHILEDPEMELTQDMRIQIADYIYELESVILEVL